MDEQVRILSVSIAEAIVKHCRPEVIEKLKQNPKSAGAFIATTLDLAFKDKNGGNEPKHK